MRNATIRGPIEAPVTVVEYGDFECPYCGQAEPFVRELLREFGDVRYVWRHLPLNDVHPHAQLAAEAAEAAAQEAFWPMHDLLLDHQDALRPADLMRYAEQLGLDIEHFSNQLREHAGANRVAEDVNSADLSGVSGTPTFFINGRATTALRHRHPFGRRPRSKGEGDGSDVITVYLIEYSVRTSIFPTRTRVSTHRWSLWQVPATLPWSTGRTKCRARDR